MISAFGVIHKMATYKVISKPWPKGLMTNPKYGHNMGYNEVRPDPGKYQSFRAHHKNKKRISRP